MRLKKKIWDTLGVPPAGRRSRRTTRDFGAKPWNFPPRGGEAASGTRDFGAQPLGFSTSGGGAARTAPLLEKTNKLRVKHYFIGVLIAIFKLGVP